MILKYGARIIKEERGFLLFVETIVILQIIVMLP